MTQDELKQAVAEAALDYVAPRLEDDCVLGIGTGSTANRFIDCLAAIKGRIGATVASSEASAERLRSHAIPVYDLNTVNQVDFYIDGADESNRALQLIKGGGGIFDVKVDGVQVVNYRGKNKRFGQTRGRRRDWKKAYVRLAEGSHIDFLGTE